MVSVQFLLKRASVLSQGGVLTVEAKVGLVFRTSSFAKLVCSSTKRLGALRACARPLDMDGRGLLPLLADVLLHTPLLHTGATVATPSHD